MDSIQLYEAARRIQPSASHAMMALAQELGIHVEFADDYKNLLGMYFNRWHHRFIFLNSRLDEDWLPMVLAHEIGHDKLHRELAKTGLQEFELFRMSSRTEYEANAFASHLLLDNDEVYRLVRAGEDMETISKRLRCNINLMLIKMREMVALGYDLRLTDTADSQFFKKVREGRLDDINRCIGWNEGCLDGFANLEMPHISCTRNPQVGLEGECPIEPAAEPKTVLIAGGGTAGMMAAKILKQEGHNPIICEASDKLGGALLLGGAIERTSEYRKAIESSARQLERAGVDIRLNTTVTPELIKQIKPDAVFCCLGAVPETPDFAKGKVNVVQARDVLAGKVHVGGKVVVIGANGTGIMAGEFVKLADPERNDVTLINRAIVVGVDLGSARKQAHATILEDESLKQSVSTDVTDIVDGKVIGVRDGETVEFPYDYAILATGCVSKAYADLENACAQLGIGFEVLGDAKEVRRAFEAAAEGFAAARRMNDPEYIKKITK